MTPNTPEHALRALAALVVKRGVALGGMTPADRELALALVWAGVPAEPMNERAVNEVLRGQLAGNAACLGTDHVELRRWLVDGGWLARDGFGREYRRVPLQALPTAVRPPAELLSGLDLDRWVADTVSREAERRAARRQAWQAAAPRAA